MTVRAALRRVYNIGRTFSLVRMSVVPAATHLPVLIGLARIRNVRRVLEFGCGQYSTLAFLNRTAFPDLEVLHSYENNAAWHAKIKRVAGGDPRFHLTYVERLMHKAVQSQIVRDYDLVFIDDSFNSRQRSATIRAVAAARPPLAVVHDFETLAYRRALNGFPHIYRFDALLPNTGIAWNDDILTVAQLRALNSWISQNRQLTSHEYQAWAKLMNGLGARLQADAGILLS
jgi:hypothetical protein